MKVLAIVPKTYRSDEPGCVVELSNDEWKIISSKLANGRSSTKADPQVGMVVDIDNRFTSLIAFERSIKNAKAAPATLRGMADALEAVVATAEKSVTPPPDESVPVDQPSKI